MNDPQSDEMLQHLKEIRETLQSRNLSDHDLLIRLSTQAEEIMRSLTDMKDSSTSRMASLEARVSGLEQARWMMLGAAGVLGTIAGVLVEFFKR